jgi:hypothetical protein
MRKILFVLGMMIGLFAQAQITYNNYLDSTCEWRYYYDDNGLPNVANFVTKYFDGDTLINGNYYYRQKNIYRSASAGFFYVPGIFYGKNVFLREDNHFNFITANNNNGVIVCDTIFKFDSISNLKYNDTIPNTRYLSYNSVGNPYYHSCAVASKDSFYIGTRKLVSVSPFTDPYFPFGFYLGIVEGVGIPYAQQVESICIWGIHVPTENLYYYNKQNNQMSFSSHNYYDSFPLPVRTKKYTTLPLKLLSFTAKQQTSNSIALNWQTINEVNVSYFNMQRSNNGNEFTSIGKLNASCCSYEFTDPLPTSHSPLTIYYRLEMVDKDGSKTYSEIKRVTLNEKTATRNILLFPNPAKALVTIQCAGTKELLIIDNLGRTIKQFNNPTEHQTLNTKQMPKGIYVVKAMMNNGDIKVGKLMIE